MLRFIAFSLGVLLSAGLVADVVDDPNANKSIIVDYEKIGMNGEYSLRQGKARGLSILGKAVQNTSSLEWGRFFQKAANSLSASNIQFPNPGYNFQLCIDEPNVLAFVMRSDPGTIYICTRMADKTDMKYVGQVLIHESVHTLRIFDECETTKVEVAAMRASGEGIAFKNGYWDDCKME